MNATSAVRAADDGRTRNMVKVAVPLSWSKQWPGIGGTDSQVLPGAAVRPEKVRLRRAQTRSPPHLR